MNFNASMAHGKYALQSYTTAGDVGDVGLAAPWPTGLCKAAALSRLSMLPPLEATEGFKR